MVLPSHFGIILAVNVMSQGVQMGEVKISGPHVHRRRLHAPTFFGHQNQQADGWGQRPRVGSPPGRDRLHRGGLAPGEPDEALFPSGGPGLPSRQGYPLEGGEGWRGRLPPAGMAVGRLRGGRSKRAGKRVKKALEESGGKSAAAARFPTGHWESKVCTPLLASHFAQLFGLFGPAH